jgi:signal transduction histidine kinase
VRRGGLLAFAAVTLAAAVLATLGYLSLRQWEASAELVLREQARDTAAMAAGKMDMTVLKAEEECLGSLQAVLLDPASGPGAVASWLGRTPLVERVFLLDREGRRRYPADPSTDDAAVLDALRPDAWLDLWDRGGRRHVVAGERVVLLGVVRGAAGPVVAALTRSESVLRRDVLEKSLGELPGKSVLAVVDAADRTVYAPRSLAGAHRTVTVPLGESLPTWRVALYQPDGLSPREVVRRQTMTFTGAFVLLLAVIVLGLAATFRMVRRESEMARLKSDFVANVSHDLKTPLSLIRMFAETLEMDRVPDPAARREYYAVITRESERLTRLIDNVLDFSRIDSGRQRYDRRPATLEPIVRETVEAFRHPLTEQGFEVTIDVEPDLPELSLDEGAIGQALGNLVDNAIKYSDARRWLRVSARRAGDGVAIEVADHGVGIPPAEVPRVFEKFYRVGRSDTQGRRGTGLGLALVKHVVEAHGGRVDVQSRPGEGSRFTLVLPASRAA